MGLELYNKLREVPPEAKKPINAGRLKGMTDINPMWRIKKLTEEFGACGIGWYSEITRQWIETGANGELCAFCNLNLYVKQGGEWSKPISGTGGSKLVTKETSGLYTSDECHKMAYTDALSVCCKMLGMGANVYFEKDRTKYDLDNGAKHFCLVCGKEVTETIALKSLEANGKVFCTGTCLKKHEAV